MNTNAMVSVVLMVAVAALSACSDSGSDSTSSTDAGGGAREGGSVATDGSVAADGDADRGTVDTKAALETIAKRKIYFAHNSVGQNILGGLDALTTQYKVTINRESASSTAFASAVFADSGVDSNGDPLGKIRDFETNRMIEVGSGPRYAFFKMCFVDFDDNSDVAAIARAYTDSAGRLKRDYPTVTFVHFTVPLCTGTDSANTKRNEFSDRIRAAFQGKEPVFDLALAESTRASGAKVTYSEGGKTYAALADDWADDDGCHLSAAGGKAMATALVKFLAALP